MRSTEEWCNSRCLAIVFGVINFEGKAALVSLTCHLLCDAKPKTVSWMCWFLTV